MEELHYYYGGVENNGNVLHHTTVVEGVVRQQVYEYDSLNRLKKGSEVNQAGGALHWQQSFTYDRFGNRNFDEAQTTPAMLGSNLAVDQNTSRKAVLDSGEYAAFAATSVLVSGGTMKQAHQAAQDVFSHSSYSYDQGDQIDLIQGSRGRH